jgi:hypothetical protein
MVRKPITGWKLVALNIFIALHLAGLFFWGLPDSPLRNHMARPFERYLVYMGLWHIWGMFAPAPLNVNYDVRATVKHKDGTTSMWNIPRMEKLPIWQRASKERYRKWSERIRADEYAMIWDDTARWIARQNNTNPTNPPVEVKMTRWWTEVPPIVRKRDYQPRAMTVEYTKSHTYAVCPITPKDLQ